jgi:hypothetical protein
MNADNFYSIAQSLWRIFGPTPAGIVGDLWALFGLYWLVSALNRKKTKRRESVAQRMLYVVPLIFAFYLLNHSGFGHGWLGTRFVPDTPLVQWLAVLITAAGVAVAFWARFHLGSNWSGVVTLKENHELIRTGPYRTIRHPIYTGILLASRPAAKNRSWRRNLARASTSTRNTPACFCRNLLSHLPPVPSGKRGGRRRGPE